MDLDSSMSETLSGITLIMEKIFSSCDVNNSDSVPAIALLEYVKPYIIETSEAAFSDLQTSLDPNRTNPNVSSANFYAVMRNWAKKVQGNSFSPAKQGLEDLMKAPQSTPRPSISPTDLNNFLNIVSDANLFQSFNFSPNATLESELKEVQQKLHAKANEVMELRSQLSFYEEQNQDLISDLERTNKRLTLEQQINNDLKKTREKFDESRDEASHYLEENVFLQKMLANIKQENSNLLSKFEEFEKEKEESEKIIKSLKVKENNYVEEIKSLRINLLQLEEENNNAKFVQKKFQNKINEQNELLEHYVQSSETMKNEIETLKRAFKKTLKEKEEENLNETKCRSPSYSQREDIKSPSKDVSSDEDEHFMVSLLEKEHFFSENRETLEAELKKLGELEINFNNNTPDIEDLQKLVKEHTNCSKVIEQLQTQVSEQEDTIESCQNSYKTLQYELDVLNEQKNKLEKDLDLLNEDKENIVKSNIKLINDNHNLNSIIKNRDKTIEQLQDECKKIDELSKEVARLEQHEELKQNELINLQNKLSKVTQERDVLKSLIEKDLTEKTERINVLQENADKLNKISKQFSIDLQETKNNYHNLKLKLSKDKQKQEELMKNTLAEMQENESKLYEIHNVLESEVGEYIPEPNEQLTEFNTDVKDAVSLISMTSSTASNKIENIKYFVTALLNRIKESSLKLEAIQSSYSHLEFEVQSLRAENKEKSATKMTKNLSYEKQQIKIEKLQKTVDSLENHIQKLQINKQISNSLLDDEWKNKALNALKDLESLKIKLKLKDDAIEKLKNECKLGLKDLRQHFETEKINFQELIKSKINFSAGINIEIERLFDLRHEELLIKEKNYNELLQKYCMLETNLENFAQEKARLQGLLEKEELKNITLQKALSDSSSEFQNFEKVLEEKESMLKFNKEQLAKSMCNLRVVETERANLEKIIRECKYLFYHKISELFRITLSTYSQWKDIILLDDANTYLIQHLDIEIPKEHNMNLEILSMDDIKKVDREVSLTVKLLSFLSNHRYSINKKPEQELKLEEKRSVNKFTLKPPKLVLKNDLYSNEISHVSPIIVDCNVQTETEDTLENGSDKSDMSLCTNYQVPLRIRENVDMAEAHRQFKQIIKNLKLDSKKIKVRCLSQKEKCTKKQDICLRSLLQIVNNIKMHKCQQEQSSLIHVLVYIEQLKNAIFEAIKLAEQYGALKQHARTLKFWNFLANYVTRLENNMCLTEISFLSTRSRDTVLVDAEQQTDKSCLLLENDDIPQSAPPFLRRHYIFGRLSSYSKYIVIIFCIYLLLILYAHWECVINGDQFTMCPLDIFLKHIISFQHNPPLF